MKRILNQTPWILLLIVGMINLVRGAFHFLTVDSGAAEAGISLEHIGASDIIYLFAIIGGAQIVLAVFYLYVALFNQKIIILALLMEIAKTSLNLYVGYAFKPSRAIVVVGGQQDQLQLILSGIALLLFLFIATRSRTASD